MKAMLLLFVTIISLLLFSPSVQAQALEKNNPIYKELAERDLMTTGEITIVYGVPCVEVMLQNGESIMTFVHSVPSLKKISHVVQDRIALINKTHYLLVIDTNCTPNDNMNTNKNKIFVPLDYSIKPKILPEYLPDAAKHEKFILLDLRQQYLGLYEQGKLKYVYPISSGSSKSLPSKNFVVNSMDEFHNSSLFDNAQMDLALNIGGNYFIHEGIVPGYPASHGCIRIFPLHARNLFYKWAKPGIHGKVVN